MLCVMTSHLLRTNYVFHWIFRSQAKYFPCLEFNHIVPSNCRGSWEMCGKMKWVEQTHRIISATIYPSSHKTPISFFSSTHRAHTSTLQVTTSSFTHSLMWIWFLLVQQPMNKRERSPLLPVHFRSVVVTFPIQRKEDKKTKSNHWLIANLASCRAPIAKMIFPESQGSSPNRFRSSSLGRTSLFIFLSEPWLSPPTVHIYCASLSTLLLATSEMDLGP